MPSNTNNTTPSSNIIWTAAEAAAATGGKVQGDWTVTGLSIDTRTIQPGDLFIALQGDARDGHLYIADALAKGAAAAMVSAAPDGVDPARLLIVNDTMTGLQALGRAARARSGAKIIAVTGSVGKTGTKEMLAAAFGALGQVHSSKGSFNNHWGVPFTLAAMHAGCDFGIFEIGMNHAHEITPLSQMVAPHIAIITTVRPVHLENFKSVDEIADAKAEIFDGMATGGIAILNRDDEHYTRLASAAVAHGVTPLSFGRHAEAQSRLTDIVLAANGSRVSARVMGEDITLNLPIPGEHIALNALSVLLAVKAGGGNLKKAIATLEKVKPAPGRDGCEYLDIGDKDNPLILLNSGYNANPDSMRAAFKVLALVDPGRGGRRIAVLGDMYELGADAAQMHRDLTMPLEAAGVNLVYTSGPLMRNLYDNLPQDKRGAHDDETRELAKIVPDVLVPGDVVLVKGSRGPGEKPRMQVVVEAMRQIREKKKLSETGPKHAV